MGKVKWSDRKTNEEVLQMVSEKRSLLSKIVNRRKIDRACVKRRGVVERCDRGKDGGEGR